ncbi:MAG: hypothetical protein IPM98_08560 [Lewinellaceae bacterium]|nr:hypothetical protein [Lewinellaceae bacterium]
MHIKASGITNLTDARYFAAKAVDFLGFNLEEGTEGYLDPMYMKAMREWVQGPKIVGEFDRSQASTVREAAAFFGLDAVQVTRVDDLPELDGLEVILYVPGAGPESVAPVLRAAAPMVAYFLLDFSQSKLNAKRIDEDADTWKALFAEYPILLDINLPAGSLMHFLQAYQPAGLALRGGAEERVGIKSFEEVDAVFDALEDL